MIVSWDIITHRDFFSFSFPVSELNCTPLFSENEPRALASTRLATLANTWGLSPATCQEHLMVLLGSRRLGGDNPGRSKLPCVLFFFLTVFWGNCNLGEL